MSMLKMEAVITLDVPITVDGAEVQQLTMRRPKVGDQMRHHQDDGMTAEGTARMYADLCMIKYEDVLAIDLIDYPKVGEAYESFLDPTPARLGQASSEP